MAEGLWEQYEIYFDLINEINEIHRRLMRVLQIANIDDEERNNIHQILINIRNDFRQRLIIQRHNIRTYYENN